MGPNGHTNQEEQHVNKTWNNGEKECVKRHGKGSKYVKGANALEKAAETKARQAAKKAIRDALNSKE